ncbi:Gfo/Idh/MocA family protein [Larkinella soli]|uniref:Gfo/Idh/MocA family protein n=1 Tax=Larkinella soli TaxID=1770527 RepID=UPI000FFC758C|nr:Gfo/Idh/MocA family oxidoreductase [Larkinella soli]
MNRLFSKSSDLRISRRDLVRACGAATLALPGFMMLGSLQSCSSKSNDSESSGGTADRAARDQASATTGRKLGIALVGLGKYSEGELAPALQETKLCRLAGIVTGTPDKIGKWTHKYDIPEANVYNYKTFDRIADNKDIDIIYVVLPNSMHAEYVIRAAQAGKHVICEKPLANSPADCRRMMDACRKAGVKFSVGYRLHFEPHNREMMRLGQQQAMGPVKKIYAQNGQKEGYDTPWRFDKELAGGGPLPDVGIYCIQGAIYTKGQVPIAVSAKYHPKTDQKKFKEVEEGMDFTLYFSDGSVAECRTSYNDTYNLLRAETDKGWFELSPAYEYSGLKGKTSQGDMNIDNVNQQARQMDAFADCILNNKETTVPAEMGLRDVQLVEAIYRAADTGRKIPTQDVAQVVDSTATKAI